MNAKYFLDTNIMVYSFEKSAKAKTAQSLIHEGLANNTAAISYQVVQEFINVASRKFKTPLKETDLTLYLDRVLIPLWSVYSSPELIKSALEIKGRWQYGFYDALIIASALSSNCPILYSEDLHHGQKIYGTEIINPFIDLS